MRFVPAVGSEVGEAKQKAYVLRTEDKRESRIVATIKGKQCYTQAVELAREMNDCGACQGHKGKHVGQQVHP